MKISPSNLELNKPISTPMCKLVALPEDESDIFLRKFR
jgi:hypothetical protein